MNILRYPNRLAMVTGGSSGLGDALCRRLELEGYAVIELSRTAARPGSLPLDLGDPEGSRAVVIAALSGLDLRHLRDFLFISTAATLDPIGPVLHQSGSAQVYSLHVNLVSAVAVITAVFGILEGAACRKVLVNISSGAAQTAHFGLTLYGMAKAAMEYFVRGFAAEQGQCPHPVVAITVDPGAMDTPMQSRLRAADSANFPGRAHFDDRHRRGELANPAHVAAEIVRIARSKALVPGARYGMRDHAGTSTPD